jgi:hypothetical protein
VSVRVYAYDVSIYHAVVVQWRTWSEPRALLQSTVNVPASAFNWCSETWETFRGIDEGKSTFLASESEHNVFLKRGELSQQNAVSFPIYFSCPILKVIFKRRLFISHLSCI